MGRANVLSHKHFLQACDAIRIHREEIANKRLTYAEVAEFLGSKLGVNVTPSNAETIARTAEVEWNRRGTHKNHLKPHAIREEIREMRARQEEIIKAVSILFHKLGERLPAGFPISPVTNGATH